MPTVINKTCVFCGKVHELVLASSKVERWRKGEHVQNVWPEMTPNEREVLISGTCSDCWDKYMVEDDDDD